MSAKADCDALLNATMPFARQMLDAEGGFLPFGAQMLRNGEIVSVLAENDEEYPDAPDLIDLLRGSFEAGAADGTLKATAMAFDVRVDLPEGTGKSRAVAVALDHRDSYSVRVFFPYILIDGKAALSAPFASDGDYAIFGRTIQ